LRKPRLAVALAALAVAAGWPSGASAHDVTLTGTDMDVGIRDYNGFAWTVELKGRIRCSGADVTNMGITFEMIEQYTQIGGGAVVVEPPPNVFHTGTVFLPPGVYRVTFGVAVCRSTQDMPEGHQGDHGEGATEPLRTTLTLPDCRRRTRTPVTPGAAMRSPLVPVVGNGGNTDMRAPCPARMCDAIASASRGWPLVPVGPGAGVPAPCSTIAVSRPNVPVEIVCGPGAMAARPAPLVPVRGGPCTGRLDLVGSSAGVANASASRVLGSKRFRIRRGTLRAVRVPLKPAARRTLNLTRVLRVRAVVRTKAGRRKSRPFTVIKRR
jgi:hypothetical protein